MVDANFLGFELDEGTILNPFALDVAAQQQGTTDVPIVANVEDHRIFMSGRFDGFRLYCLVTYTRPEIMPGSVTKRANDRFTAVLRFETSPGAFVTEEVYFNSPILPLQHVMDGPYGHLNTAFMFSGYGMGREGYNCDLAFLTQYALNAPVTPLKLHYIGIAKAEGRDAFDRLGEGHSKLQSLLIKQNNRPTLETTSIILYRPNTMMESAPGTTSKHSYSTAEIVETIEATLIQHFKPKANIERLNFPDDSPKLGGVLRDRGILGIETKILAPKNTALYSDLIAPSESHIASVRL